MSLPEQSLLETLFVIDALTLYNIVDSNGDKVGHGVDNFSEINIKGYGSTANHIKLE